MTIPLPDKAVQRLIDALGLSNRNVTDISLLLTTYNPARLQFTVLANELDIDALVQFIDEHKPDVVVDKVPHE